MILGVDASNVRGGGGLTHLLELLRFAEPGDAGFDRIIVKDLAGTQYYVIDKIYKLEGKEQAKGIKERLRKN